MAIANLEIGARPEVFMKTHQTRHFARSDKKDKSMYVRFLARRVAKVFDFLPTFDLVANLLYYIGIRREMDGNNDAAGTE